MRHFILLAAAGLFLSLGACKNGPAGVQTEHGYNVVNHTKKGGPTAKTGDVIKIHVATFVGDSLFQDTRKISPEPREVPIPDLKEIPAGRKVPPIFDAALISSKGDSVTIYQPVDSLIERQLPESLKKEKFVRYEVVIVDIITKEDQDKAKAALAGRFAEVEAKAQATAKDYKAGKLNGQLTTLPSGLKVLIEDKGAGGPLAQGEQVKTHYYGCLTTGKSFDNSYQRGEPLAFALGVGQMIPGFDEGTQQLNHGGKAFFFIPAKLGYGDREMGEDIPANSELIFYVEVQ